MKLHARQIFRILLFGLFMLGALYVATVLSILQPWQTHGDYTRDRQMAETALVGRGIRWTGDVATILPGGPPYSRGYMHGRLLAGPIRELDAVLNQLMDAKGFHVPLLGKAMAVRKARRLEAQIPYRYIAEMRGVADGSGVPYADILLFNVFDDLLYVHGCSSLGLEKGSAAGEWIHARNLDYLLHQLARYKTVMVQEWGTSPPTNDFVSVGFPGYIGVLTGINSRGISLSAHTSISADNAVGVPSGFLYRRIMEEAGTLDQAVAILRTGPRTIGNNILLGSFRENRFVAAEVTARRCETRAPEGGVVVVTNHFQCAALGELQRGPDRLLQGSRQRAKTLQEFQSGLGRPAGVADVRRWFASTKGQGAVFPSVANKGTVQGVIFAPAEGAFYVAKGNRTPVTTAGYLRLLLPFPSTPVTSAGPGPAYCSTAPRQ